MMQHSTRFYPVDRLLVFCTAFQRFIKPVARSVASYLVGVLQPILFNQHSVKDSFSFADWAKKYKHNNGIMCSLDVCSLLTNVPLDETIDIAVDKLFSF